MPRDNDKSSGPPRGTRGAGRHAGGSGKSFGARKGPGDKKSFGDKKPFGEKKSFGARKPYGDKKPFGDKKSFGDKPYGDRKSGEKRPYAARAGSDRPRPERSGDERPRPRYDRDARPAANRDDRPARGPRKDFAPRAERGGEDRPRPRFDRDARPPRDRDDRPQRAPRGDFKPRREHGGEERPRFKPREDRGDRGFASRGEGRPAGRSDAKFGDKRPYQARDRDTGSFKKGSFKGEGFRKDGDRRFKRGPRDDAGRDRTDEKPWQRRAAPARDEARRERPHGDRPRGDRPDRAGTDDRAPRKFSRPRDGGDRPKFDRPRSERATFARPRGGRDTWKDHPRSDDRQGGDERPRGEQDDARIFVKRPAFGGRGAYRERTPEKERRRPPPANPAKSGERIAKLLARAGLCSRRDAEEWVMQGRVAVNGRVLTSPALDVTDRDVVTVDGKPLPERERTRLFLYHKPRGLMTTHDDPEGRPTVFDNLPGHLPRLISIGRLDFNTEGLLLLTNDGGLARALELPETGWLRRYRVRAHGTVTQAQLDALKNGVEVEGVKYGAIDAQLEHDQGANVWIVFAIREGKNREVRNVLGHLGLEVNRLIRVSYGPFQLAELGEGEVEEVKTRVLREQLGDKIAGLASADFQAPVTHVQPADDDAPREERKAKPRSRAVIADRKGRRVLVERSGDAEDGERPYRRPKRGYHGKRDIKPRDE